VTQSESFSKASTRSIPSTEFQYHGFSPELTPIVPAEVSHDLFPGPIQVFAKVDTGFPGTFIMSETLGKTLKDTYHIFTNERGNLVAVGVFTVFCEVFSLAIKLPQGRWVRVKALLPQGIDLGNIVGMELLKTVNACFKGNESKIVLTPSKAE